MKGKVPLTAAKQADVEAIGFSYIPDDRQPAKALEKMAELRKKMRSLMVMLETCTKCGNCAKQCHSFLGTEDYYNFPAARAELFRRIYKRYFTLAGKLFGRFAGAEDITEETLSKWFTYYYQCNECRRCARFCPFGIDTAEVTIIARHILSEIGIIPKFLQAAAANLIKTGNNMGIPKPAVIDSAEFMQDEMREETGVDIKIPVDKHNSEILYIPSSADFFVNVDTMIGAAKLFHVLGANWTIPSCVLEGGNFGLLFNFNTLQEHNLRMKKAAEEFGAKIVIQGECGHGWRAARMYTNGLNGPVPFKLLHIHEYCDENLSKLTLKKLPLKVALHDPCNYARAGGIIEQPRRILRACVKELVELSPNREDTFCCGGGSGILMDEMLDIRMKLGRKKAEQINAVGPIDYLAIPCSICKAQIPAVVKHYGMADKFEMGGVMDIVGKSLDIKKI
jgi:Fe-S oxidoreductase